VPVFAKSARSCERAVAYVTLCRSAISASEAPTATSRATPRLRRREFEFSRQGSVRNARLLRCIAYKQKRPRADKGVFAESSQGDCPDRTTASAQIKHDLGKRARLGLAFPAYRLGKQRLEAPLTGAISKDEYLPRDFEVRADVRFGQPIQRDHTRAAVEINPRLKKDLQGVDRPRASFDRQSSSAMTALVRSAETPRKRSSPSSQPLLAKSSTESAMPGVTGKPRKRPSVDRKKARRRPRRRRHL
jgi:hypothetical protein